jgi:hypothetical protein
MWRSLGRTKAMGRGAAGWLAAPARGRTRCPKGALAGASATRSSWHGQGVGGQRKSTTGVSSSTSQCRRSRGLRCGRFGPSVAKRLTAASGRVGARGRSTFRTRVLAGGLCTSRAKVFLPTIHYALLPYLKESHACLRLFFQVLALAISLHFHYARLTSRGRECSIHVIWYVPLC